jgi:4a-hydroxytetrahydrobiopterin dehydratase
MPEDWNESEGALRKTFVFRNFLSAFTFITEIAEISDLAEHSSGWGTSSHKVKVRLTTRNQGICKVTQLNLEQAEKIDTIYQNFRK